MIATLSVLPPVVTTVILAVLSLVTLVGPAAGQDWNQQSALPTGWDLTGIAFLTPDHGYICGDDRVLMRTTDGGASWQQVASVSRTRGLWEDEFRALAFADDLHGWVVGNDNYRTTDGGQTWQDMGFFGGTNADIDVIDADVVYVRADWALSKTTDGGASWFTVFPAEGIDRVNDMDWWDAERGVLDGGGDQPGSAAGLYLTLDGGATWSFVRDVVAADVTFVAPEVLLWHDVYGLTLYRSEDLGQTATPVLDAVDVPIEVIHRIDADRILAMDAAVRIWISEDGGLTWTRTHEQLGARGLQWPGVHFLDAMNGWIVTEDGLMLQTTDGGLTWTQRSDGIGAELESIVVYPDGRGLAVGEQGAVIETDDSGATWTLQPMLFAPGGVESDLVHLETVGSRVYLLNKRGIVYLSEDRGATWARLENSPYWPSGELFRTDFLDEQTGFMFGRTPIWGLIHRTTDGGESWVTVMDQGDSEQLPMDSQMFTADTGVYIGSGGAFYTTADGWSTWTRRDVEYSESWRSLGFASPQVGWIGSNVGTVATTSDGGDSWTPVFLPGITDGDVIVAIDASSESEVRILARDFDVVRVFETFDGGATWAVSQPPVNPDAAQPGANDFFVGADGAIWTAGWGGFILARGATATGVGDGVVPDVAATVLHGAAPNPFNPRTVLSFSLPLAGDVRLVLHDLRGRVVTTLVDGHRGAGLHRVSWDGRDASGRPQASGTYLARLVWGGGMQTSKLSLVR